MVISTSLALGLLIGFFCVSLASRLLFYVTSLSCFQSKVGKLAAKVGAENLGEKDKAAYDNIQTQKQRDKDTRERFEGMFTSPDEDPQDVSSRRPSMVSTVTHTSASASPPRPSAATVADAGSAPPISAPGSAPGTTPAGAAADTAPATVATTAAATTSAPTPPPAQAAQEPPAAATAASATLDDGAAATVTAGRFTINAHVSAV